MYRVCSLLLLLVCIALLSCASISGLDAMDRFVIHYDSQELYLPFAANHSIQRTNPSIRRIVIAIHGLGYNPMDYLENGIGTARVAGELEHTLILAPFFMTEEHLPELPEDNLLFWEVWPFAGSNRSYQVGSDHRIRLSSFTVLDILLEHLVDERLFPNLESIVIAGHSAGGQLVNRYAASNRFDVAGVKPEHIQMRYIVMAPSTYLYFDETRPTGTNRSAFAAPNEAPDGYNDYHYGLDNLHAYLRETGAPAIRQQYAARTVYYLVGELDNDPNCSTLARGSAAMLQGNNRLARSLNYYSYLGHYFGQAIYNNHHHAVVPGAGHWGLRLMLSEAGIQALYDVSVSFTGP